MTKKIYNYGMFSNKGNKLVAKRVNELKKKNIKPKGYLDFEFFYKNFKKIYKKHKEVNDTMVRENIVKELGV